MTTIQDIAKKRKEREAHLVKLEAVAKAAQTSVDSGKKLDGVLKTAQAALKTVQD